MARNSADQDRTGERAETEVFDCLRWWGPSTHAELVERLRWTQRTVTAAVARLTAKGEVEKAAATRAAGTVGRTPVLLRLTPKAGHVVGVEIERRHVRVLVGDLGHRVLEPGLIENVSIEDPNQVLDTAARLVRQALAREGLATEDVRAIGVGLCAAVGIDGKVAVKGDLNPQWLVIDTAAELRVRLGVDTVVVDNDANLGALGVLLFPAESTATQNLLYVQVNEGIGAGLVIGGDLFRGSHGIAGEIGHVTLDANISAPLCRKCGAHGCLDLYASGEAIVAQAQLQGYAVGDLSDVIALALGHDPGCERIIADAGDRIGTALGGVFNLFDPDRVVLGGELAKTGRTLQESVQAHLHRNGPKPVMRGIEVEISQHREWSTAYGALGAALRATPTRR